MGLSLPLTLGLPGLPGLRRLTRHPRPVLARATDETTERLAALVVGVPDEMIDALMRTPARRIIIEAIFWLMPRYLDRTGAAGLDACLRWRVTSPASTDEPEIFDLDISGRRCRVHRGAGARRPIVTITIDAAEMVRLAAGKSSPMQAYFAGRLALRGDIVQAARLASVFRAPAGALRNTARRPSSAS